MTGPLGSKLVSLIKITGVLVSQGPITRTALAKASGVRYIEMSRRLRWLEEKQYVTIEAREGKIVVILTERGKALAVSLMNLDQ